MTFPTKRLKDTIMKLINSDEMFIAFALSMIVASPILLMHLSASGDSTTQRKEPIQRLLTTPSAEIK
jgi:hypothetical protein